MESAIRLCCTSLPSAPLRLFHGAKGLSDARPSRFNLKFNRATPCFSHFSTHHAVARSFGHVNCMLNRFFVPSENEESSDNNILKGVTGVSLALACVLGLFNISSKMNPKLNTAYAAWPFSSPTPMSDKQPGDDHEPRKLPGGEDALESLLKMIKAKEHTNPTPPQFDHTPDKAAVDALKLYAVGLSKSGNQHEAYKVLKNAYDKHKDHPEAKLNLGMALVELLIFQAKFEEARGRVDQQIDQQLSDVGEDPTQLKYEEKIDKLLKSCESDEFYISKHSIAQLLLYKAIIQSMLENKEAAKWFEAFMKTLT